MLEPQKHNVNFVDWGLIDYKEALLKQEELLERVASNEAPASIIFCSHPPTVTLGRKTEEGDVFAWQGPTYEISRGGRATYHGPSQIVVYPIIKVKDIHAYLRNFEQAIVATLAEYGIEAQGKSLLGDKEETGVWVSGKKIASLGIGVRKWVSFHGAAINFDHDPKAFQGMNPCGLSASIMTSVEEVVGKNIERVDFIQKLKNKLKEML